VLLPSVLAFPTVSCDRSSYESSWFTAQGRLVVSVHVMAADDSILSTTSSPFGDPYTLWLLGVYVVVLVLNKFIALSFCGNELLVAFNYRPSIFHSYSRSQLLPFVSNHDNLPSIPYQALLQHFCGATCSCQLASRLTVLTVVSTRSSYNLSLSLYWQLDFVPVPPAQAWQLATTTLTFVN
jgi:hypothetical protein